MSCILANYVSFFKTSNALNVISSKFPMGVETIYKHRDEIFIYEK